MTLLDWETPDPAEILVLAGDADWEALAQRYPSTNEAPLLRCFEVARANGATTVVIETRYIDLDYRSEYSAFYSRTFQAIPDSAHRLHFFRAPLRSEQLWQLPVDHGYVGYMVVRPSELGRVGRAMLPAPPGLESAVRTAVTDRVNFFGQELRVEASPFVQQDTQLGRCAHSAAWMCHFSAFLRGDVSRRPMAAFSLSADPGLGLGRPLPSPGLTVHQLLELLRIFDLPPAFYYVQNLPPSSQLPWPEPDPTPPSDAPDRHPGFWDWRIIRIVCRYLNSGLPVLVGTRDHAFVLCGYRRDVREGARDWITFIRHDDQRGPYLLVGDVLNDIDSSGYSYSPWEYLIVPLPEKLWLPPEPVEATGAFLMQGLATNVARQVPEATQLSAAITAGELALRTFAIRSNSFKASLDGRLEPSLVREYRLARLPRYTWVVEAIDRRLRAAGQPCVLGEAVFDATSSETLPKALIVHIPGIALLEHVGISSDPPRLLRCGGSAYETGGVGPS